MLSLTVLIKMSGVPATVLSFVALALGIIGWAIPYWEYYGNILGQLHIGLWEYCAGFHGNLFGIRNMHDCQRLGITFLTLMGKLSDLLLNGSSDFSYELNKRAILADIKYIKDTRRFTRLFPYI